MDEEDEYEEEGILHGWTPVEILSQVVAHLDLGYGPNPGNDALESLGVTREDIGVPDPSKQNPYG